MLRRSGPFSSGSVRNEIPLEVSSFMQVSIRVARYHCPLRSFRNTTESPPFRHWLIGPRSENCRAADAVVPTRQEIATAAGAKVRDVVGIFMTYLAYG